MRKKIMIAGLVILAVYAFPLDLGIILNRLLGWKTHIVLFLCLMAVILYMSPGKTLTNKWNYIKGMVNLK